VKVTDLTDLPAAHKLSGMLISVFQIDLDSLARLPPKYFTHRLAPLAERLPMRAKASRSRPPPLLFFNAQHTCPKQIAPTATSA
jgi:hypothetical protein